MRYRSARRWWRRLHLRLRSARGTAVKSHRVDVTTIAGRRYKRVTFKHASEAMRVAGNLERVAPLGRFPGLVHWHENSLWVQYLEGATLEPRRSAHSEGVVDFFAALYGFAPYRIQLDDTPIHQRLLADLGFLEDAALLPRSLVDSLLETAEARRPVDAWMGFDYLDPLARNFVAGGSGTMAIDVEALEADRLLGMGLAKARLRWLDVERSSLLEKLERGGAPDIATQIDYAALSFLAAYARQQFFRGRPRRINPGDFRRLLDTLSS